MAMDTQEQCVHLREFGAAQIDVIQRHLDRHKWFNGIADSNKAIEDFCVKYGWLMRDFYCHHCCEKRNNCHLADSVNDFYSRRGM
jgi:hypothetical protein